MPALAVRDVNVPVPVPPTPRKDGAKHAAATKPQPLPSQPHPADPLVAQRCLAFLAKLQSQHAASAAQCQPGRSQPPPLPDLAPHVARVASPAAGLLHVGAAYEAVGHWLHGCDKHSQAAAILRNAATVYDACGAAGKALLARIDVGRAINAAAVAQPQSDKAEHARQADAEQAQQHWLAVRQQVLGKDLRLESYACYHHGQLHAHLAARCGRAAVERSSQLFDRALEVWTQLADIPHRYAPTMRAADSDQMRKHRQHVLRVEDAVQTAAQRCALYSQQRQQVSLLQWLADCLSSALLQLPAAVCWLQCAVVAATERDVDRARHCLSQAELSHSQPAAITADTLGRDKLATYELRYSILLFQLTVLLHSPSSAPPSPPPALAAFLSQPVAALSFAQQMLRAQLLSVLSRVELKRGRIGESESHCRREYKLWSGCLRRLLASSTAAAAAIPSLSAADMAALVAAQPALACDHYAVLWWYVDCLYRYARLMEWQGQPLLSLAHLSKATAVCEALDEQRHRRRLERLRWRVKVKLGWQLERLEGSGTQQAAEGREKWEMAADEAVQSLKAALAGEQQSGSDLLLQAQLSAELGDAYLRQGHIQAASDSYQCALVASQTAYQQTATSAVQQPDTITKRKPRTTSARAVKPQPKAQEERVAEPANDPILLQQAALQAKLASIALSSPTTPSAAFTPTTATASSLNGAVASLLRSSSTFERLKQWTEVAWAAYWQAVARRADAPASPASSRSVWSFPDMSTTRPRTDASYPLRSCCTSACTSLLYSAISSTFTSSPPFVSRLLLTSLCSSLGLSSPLNAVFALNASLGIATRHSTNRTLRQRPATPAQTQPTTDASLSNQLAALQLSTGSDDQAQGQACDQSVFGLDGGLELDRERFDVEFVGRLPVEWSVVTIALSDDRCHLLVSRVQSPQHARAPVLLRLPLGSTHTPAAPRAAASSPLPAAAPGPRVTRGKGKPAAAAAKSSPASNAAAPAEPTTERPPEATSSSYHAVLSELCAVLDASGRVNSSSFRSQHTCTYDERREWWSERQRLDDRMQRLLQRMEEDWFGPWKGVLCGDERDDGRRRLLQDGVVRVVEGMQRVLGGATALDGLAPLFSYVRALLQSSTPISPSQLRSAVAYLLGWKDCARESEAAMQAMRSSRSATEWQQLTDVCAMVEAERQVLHPTPSAQLSLQSRLPVILLLSSELQRLPFESMPVLDSQPVTRMPSWLQLLPFLPPRSSSLQSGVYTQLSLASHAYVLNPANDLPRTQSTFAPLLAALGLTTGTAASPPAPVTLLSYLAAHLYVYVGHGSGDQYVAPHQLAAADVAGVCLLMGCSSGRGRGGSVEYEGCEGMVGGLLMGGAKCVVGNLWDVTDGECDRFAVRLLEQITGKRGSAAQKEENEIKQPQLQEAKPVRKGRGKKVVQQMHVDEAELPKTDTTRLRTVCELVASSRSACKLRYLMGGSPVVYGIPAAFPTTV